MNAVSRLAELAENLEEIVTTISEHYQFEVFNFTMEIYVPSNSTVEIYADKPKDDTYWIVIGSSAYSTISCFQLDFWLDNLLIIHDPCFQPQMYKFENYLLRGMFVTAKNKFILRVVNPNSQELMFKMLVYMFKIPESLYYSLQQKYYKVIENFIKS